MAEPAVAYHPGPWDLPKWSRRPTGDPTLPLDAQMLHTAVRVIGESATSTSRRRKRLAIGTGFLMTVNSATKPNVRYGYVLTAAHVLKDHPGKWEIQIPHIYTGVLSEPMVVTDWQTPIPKLDLAVAMVPPSAGQTWTALPIETAVAEYPRGGLFPHLGEPVYYIGILMPLDRAMVRSGTLGAIDQEGVDHDGGWEYPCHLVDCRSYGGFSGSPCFVEFAFPGLTPRPLPAAMRLLEQHPSAPGGEFGRMGYFAAFCGMFTESLADKSLGIPYTRYGVGVMLRAAEIQEALMSEKLVEERRLLDEEDETEYDKPHLKGESRRSESDESNPEFDRFKDLTRKLVNTSKPPKESDSD
ncbi:MAG: serine protease [Candidatus Dormiibacterota bacterium]